MQIQMGKVSVFKMKLHYWQGIFVKLWTKLYTKLSVDHPPPKTSDCSEVKAQQFHQMAQLDFPQNSTQFFVQQLSVIGDFRRRPS